MGFTIINPYWFAAAPSGGVVDIVDASPTNAQGTGGSINTTYTAAVGSDRIVVMLVHCFNAGGPGTLSATMGAQAFTSLGETTHTSGFEKSEIFIIKEANIPSGSQTVTLTSTTSDTLGFQVFTIENAHQTTAPVFPALAAGNNTSLAITPAVADSLIVGTCWESTNTSTLAWSATLSDYGTFLSIAGTARMLAGKATGQAASSQTCTFTSSSTQRASMALASFAPA